VAALPGRWVLYIQHLRSEKRPGKSFARTVGTYQVLHNGSAIGSLSGTTVERQGPGDNGSSGKKNHNRIEAGTYPIYTHRTAKYRTAGFVTTGDHPRPALGIGNTGKRTGILVHPAGEYGSTIGCINLGSALAGPQSNIKLVDSIARVVAVIKDLKSFMGAAFPNAAEAEVPGAYLVIED
jgi:hypothetical protein